jgi:hypothetical protein
VGDRGEMRVDAGCPLFLLCTMVLVAPWTGPVGCLVYTLGAWVAVVVASRCALARVLSVLAGRLLGRSAAVSIGGCPLSLLGQFSLTDLRVRLPAGPHAQVQIDVSSVELSVPIGRSLLSSDAHGAVRFAVGRVQATLHLRPGWQATTGTAAPSAAAPREAPEDLPPTAARRGSRLKAALLKLVRVDSDEVAVVISGCQTPESKLQQLSLVLPGIELYTEAVEGERDAVDVCACTAHPISMFAYQQDSRERQPSFDALMHRALKVGACQVRARLAGGHGMRATSCKVEMEDAMELHVNSALLASVFQFAATAKSRRQSTIPSREPAREQQVQMELRLGKVSLSADLGGHTLVVNLVSLVGRPDTVETRQVSVLMSGHTLIHAPDCVTYERSTAANTQTLRATSLRTDLPHELHFGNSLADMLTDLKAIKRAVSSGISSGAAAPASATNHPAPTFVFVCDSFRLCFADDPMDSWLNSRYPHLRDEHGEVVVDWQAFDQKCNEEFGVGKTDPDSEQVQRANHLIREKGAKRYRERLLSGSVSGSDTPVLDVKVGAVELKLVQDDWACSLDGVLARVEEYGGQLPAESKTPFGFTELIGRTVSLDLRDTRVQLRDFSFPVLKAGALSFSGPLIIAEQSTSDLFCLRKSCAVGNTSTTVTKSLAPMKVYHSLRCDARDVELNYGVAILPALADASNAAARLSSDSLDPAKPLPWWDKLRYKVHGKFTGSLNSVRLRLLADHDPHAFNNNMVVDITQLELDLDGNTWSMVGRDMNMRLVTPSADLADTLYFPVLSVAANMRWSSFQTSHYTLDFAKTVHEAFPNKMVYADTSAEPGPSEWSGAVLLPDTLRVLPMDKFRASSWTLGLQIGISGAQGSSASVSLWHSSLVWLGRLYNQLIAPPKSRAAVMKMTRSKIGMPRKKKVQPLGEMLKTLDLQLHLGQGTLRFWNREEVCVEAALAAAGLRLQSILADSESTPPAKITGVHIVASNVVARFLVDQEEAATGPGMLRLGSCGSVTICHNLKSVPVLRPEMEKKDDGVQLPPVTPDSEVLLENLFGDPSSVPPQEDQELNRAGSHLRSDGLAVTVSDMLMWCSLESRNALYDWILSFDSVVETAVAKTPGTRAHEKMQASYAAAACASETMQSDEDLLSFLSRTGPKVKPPHPAASPAESHEHPHATVFSIRFVRPQIRLESESFGTVFLTALGATIENSTHTGSELTRVIDDVGRVAVGNVGEDSDASLTEVKKVLQVALDQAQMFAAPAGSMKADERIPWKDCDPRASQAPITSSRVVLGRAQRILAPCPIHVAYTRWKRQEKQRANMVTVHIDSVALAMSARHFETLSDVFENVVLIRPPRKAWLDEEKKRIFFEQQTGSSQEAVDTASELYKSLLGIRHQLHGLPDDRQQARAALKVKERATAERMMEVAQEGTPRSRARRSDALASLDLQLRVDVSSVDWYMMDQTWEPTAYFAMRGAAVIQEHFADLSTHSTISIDDFVMMDDLRNEVFARNHIPVLPGQTSVDEDKLLTVHWKTEGMHRRLQSASVLFLVQISCVCTEDAYLVAFTVYRCVCAIAAGQWKAGIKVFDRLEVELQPVRVSINQDLIDQIKLYTFPPPHDTRMAQQAFIFGGGAVSSSAPAASVGATDLETSAVIDQGNSEPEPAAAVGTGRDGDKSHFGDRDLGFEDEFAEDELPAASKRGADGRISAADAPGRLSLEPSEAQEDRDNEDCGAQSVEDSSASTQAADLTVAAMERAQKAHAFGTIRIGTLDIEASYTGKMLPAFDRLPLQVKTINYKREVWTMQELLEHLGWDIKKAVLKSVANSTISGMGSKMSKFAGQMLAPAAGGKRSQFEMKKQQLLGQVPLPAPSDRNA